MIKNCLKSDLVAEIGRAKVPKEADPLSLAIAFSHVVDTRLNLSPFGR
jgi:hypothetical protein